MSRSSLPVCVVACIASLSLFADGTSEPEAAEVTKRSSAPTFVFLRPENSSFWNTATNGTMTLPICYPQGETRATLAVTGMGYEYVTNLPENATSVDLALPEPTSPKMENVYTLTLSFAGAEPFTAKIGLIQGLAAGGRGSTRCLAPKDGNAWNKVRKRAVLPIPYGMTSFQVNGVEVDPGLNGAQGWYPLGPLLSGDSALLSLTAGGISYSASLMGVSDGTIVVFE